MAPSAPALGFKLHTGWGACVAVTGKPNSLRVLARCRAVLLPADGSIPRFVYHAAAELGFEEARALVMRAQQTVLALAESVVAGLIDELHRIDAVPQGCGVIIGSARLKEGMDLAEILKAHPLVHAAEGRLFQEAIIRACIRYGLPVTTVSEREVWAAAAKAARCNVEALRREVEAQRTSVGPPWSADEKSATAAAIAAIDRPTTRGSSPRSN